MKLNEVDNLIMYEYVIKTWDETMPVLTVYKFWPWWFYSFYGNEDKKQKNGQNSISRLSFPSFEGVIACLII